MATFIQVCGCVADDDDDVTPFVPDTEATFYGLYLCKPLAMWLEDYETKAEAMDAARKLAKELGCEVDDRTFISEHEGSTAD